MVGPAASRVHKPSEGEPPSPYTRNSDVITSAAPLLSILLDYTQRHISMSLLFCEAILENSKEENRKLYLALQANDFDIVSCKFWTLSGCKFSERLQYLTVLHSEIVSSLSACR